MSDGLARLAAGAGLELDWRRPDEAAASCPEAEFADRVTELAGSAVLADLFATTATGPAQLTAVLQLVSDPSWLLLSAELAGVTFPSLTPRLHAASWYEREIFEMHGLLPEGHPAPGPLRLHDWPEEHHPMRPRAGGVARLPHPPHVPKWPAVTGQGVFQFPLGPVRSGPQEAAEFHFSSGGEDIVALGLRLGFKYRAIERLAQGQPAERALQLAERLAGTSGFANGLAFTRAVERALGVTVTQVSEHTRALLAELERLHSHWGTIGRLAESTGLLVGAAQYGLLKEDALREAGRLTGHRYLRGALRIGGLELELGPSARRQLRAQLDGWRERATGLGRLLEDTSTFQDRLDTTALLSPEYAREHNLVGPVGRASGIDRDTRRDHPYAAYSEVLFDVPSRAAGDAAARFQVHVAESTQSLRIMAQLLDDWPADAGPAPAPQWHSGSALGWAEAPGGETLHFVELDPVGRVARWRARPPAVVNWHPFAHACGSGNNLTDYPVIEASFAISPAEFDR